jgi:hypothetical protein
VRLATTATDTVAPSTIATPPLCYRPFGRFCLMVARWAASHLVWAAQVKSAYSRPRFRPLRRTVMLRKYSTGRPA